MDKCNDHIDEYILKSDHQHILQQAIHQNSQYYKDLLDRTAKDHLTQVDHLTQQYRRADTFLHVVSKSLAEIVNKNDPKVNLRWLNLDLHSPTLETYEMINNLLQMGLDFEILLYTMKNDETLYNQWKNILMIMRLAGYDSFDMKEEI